MEGIKTLDGAIAAATKTIDHFFNSKLDQDKQIPIALLQSAKGLVFLTVVKVGLVWTGKIGVGCVIAKMDNGKWSAPSGIGTAGIGFGAEFGGQVIDFMIILSSDNAVRSFMDKGQISIGTNLELAAGPYGRAVGASANITTSGVAPSYTYSHSKGIFAGVGLHGSAIASRNDLNKKFYGFEIYPKEILTGCVDPPEAAAKLYEAIDRAMATNVHIKRGGSTLYQTPSKDTPPAAAKAREISSIYEKVIQLVETIQGSHHVEDFKSSCKSFGQDSMTIEEFLDYLNTSFNKNQLLLLLPDLVRLLPNLEKRTAVWALYTQLKATTDTAGDASSVPSLF